MPLTAERLNRAFAEALTYDSFIESVAVNHDRLIANDAAYELSEADRAVFDALPQPIDVLVLAHDWCGDVVANLPLFGKIARETGKLRLHILNRDPDNTDIATLYQHSDGRNHIPTYIFFTPEREELGVFIERPDTISTQLHGWVDEFWAAHPDLEGRGLAVGKLPDATKKPLLAYITERRTQVREQEKTAIIEAIIPILNNTSVAVS